MKKNILGEPIPRGATEIGEALMHFDMIVDDVTAMIDFNTEDGDFTGFTAEVRDEDGQSFTTLGYESKEQLIADLASNDIRWYSYIPT